MIPSVLYHITWRMLLLGPSVWVKVKQGQGPGATPALPRLLDLQSRSRLVCCRTWQRDALDANRSPRTSNCLTAQTERRSFGEAFELPAPFSRSPTCSKTTLTRPLSPKQGLPTNTSSRARKPKASRSPNLGSLLALGNRMRRWYR